MACAHSDAAAPSSIPEKTSFWWIGFCARDCFKHSEAKWHPSLLPRLFSEALETGTAPGLQCTKVEHYERLNARRLESTSVLLPISSRFSQTMGWPSGLSRDHFIPHLPSLQSATLFSKVLLTCNAWTIFRVRFQYHFYRLRLRGSEHNVREVISKTH